MRIIKVMPEYRCFPLWEESEENTDTIDPHHLPISRELQVALETWRFIYEKTYNEDYPPDSGFDCEAEIIHFVKEGEKIVDRLARELRGIAVIKKGFSKNSFGLGNAHPMP